jgi:hypothetical protein
MAMALIGRIIDKQQLPGLLIGGTFPGVSQPLFLDNEAYMHIQTSDLRRIVSIQSPVA